MTQELRHVHLPPPERDFEIYHVIQILGSTTRALAQTHEISQTRVRQIVRRVLLWVAQLLPSQAEIAKEKEVHLARPIAADRFQHQYEQASESWRQTSESKYMGLRMRITTAQARLGVVGGHIDGLIADAIEGLPVPIADPPVEDCSKPDNDPTADEMATDANPYDEASSIRIEGPLGIHDAPLLNRLRSRWSPSQRIQFANVMEDALQLLPPDEIEKIRAAEAQRFSPEQLAREAAARTSPKPKRSPTPDSRPLTPDSQPPAPDSPLTNQELAQLPPASPQNPPLHALSATAVLPQ